MNFFPLLTNKYLTAAVLHLHLDSFHYNWKESLLYFSLLAIKKYVEYLGIKASSLSISFEAGGGDKSAL